MLDFIKPTPRLFVGASLVGLAFSPFEKLLAARKCIAIQFPR